MRKFKHFVRRWKWTITFCLVFPVILAVNITWMYLLIRAVI